MSRRGTQDARQGRDARAAGTPAAVVAPARSEAAARRVRRAARLVPPRGERLLPILSGLLLVLSFPPFQLLVPPFVALVPFLAFIADRPADVTGRWSAIRAGYLMGLVYFGMLLYWLIVALIYYSPLAVLAWLVTVVILAGFTAIFGAGLVLVRQRVPVVPMALAAALFWTALEWLQGHLGDVSFPWLGLGSSLTGFPQLAGAADLVGARGLTFWLVLVNGLIASSVVAWRRGRSPLRPAILAALAIAIPAGYGFARAATLRLVPAARVAVVQPNIPEDLKMDLPRALDSSYIALTNLTRRVQPGSVDLVVWPEVALQALIASPTPVESALRERVQELSREVRAPIMVGAYGYSTTQAKTFYNAAMLMTPAGLQGTEYDKQFLVPIVERVPFIDPAWLERITGPMEWFGGLGRGTSTELFPAGRARFGVMICYESIFAPLSRHYRRDGADFLVNMTNDSWYGRQPFWARTSALWQHPAHMVMRAIETRTGVARAANTGISMFIDPIGRKYDTTPLFVPDVRVATVYTTGATTLFTLWGDWLATACAALSVILVLVCVFQKRRAVGSLPPS